MSVTGRKLLSLPQKAPVDTEEREFELDLFDVLLPCRNFHLSYRYAEVGSHSLVTEFLLRLVHAAENISEEDVAAFFGFNAREMRFALESVQAEGHVSRSGGEISLTQSGRGLFRYDQSTPQLYSVTSRQSTFGFDLIALAPQETSQLPEFERALKELPISNVERVSHASAEIRRTFRKWFYELMSRNEKDAMKKASLYSIDEVSAGRRYSAVVPVLLRGSSLRPSFPVIELANWRPMQEVDDRGDVVEAISAYVENLKVPARSDDRVAYSILRDVASGFLDEFTRKDGLLSVERYFNETIKRAGELRSDRPTVPIVGTLFTPSNNRRLREALSYGRKKTPAPHRCHRVTWLVPTMQWGHTRALVKTLSDFGIALADGDSESSASEVMMIALCSDKPPDHVAKAFHQVVRAKDVSQPPPSLEMLLVPGLMASVLVHCPIQTPRGIPVPLGILSFDELIIQRVHAYFAGIVSEDIILGEAQSLIGQ